MTPAFVRRIAFAIIGVVLLAGGLRLWGVIAYPPLDVYDRRPLAPVLVCGVVAAALAATTLPRAWRVPRLVAAPLVFAITVSLAYGGILVANGALDQTPTYWLQYTIREHLHARRSTVSLERSGPRGPGWLYLPDYDATRNLPPGTPILVPVRRGVFGLAWRPADPTVAR